MATKNPIKTLHNFSCSTCSFICCNKKDYIRHLATAKHEFQQNQHEKPQKTPIPKFLIKTTVYVAKLTKTGQVYGDIKKYVN